MHPSESTKDGKGEAKKLRQEPGATLLRVEWHTEKQAKERSDNAESSGQKKAVWKHRKGNGSGKWTEEQNRPSANCSSKRDTPCADVWNRRSVSISVGGLHRKRVERLTVSEV